MKKTMLALVLGTHNAPFALTDFPHPIQRRTCVGLESTSRTLSVRWIRTDKTRFSPTIGDYKGEGFEGHPAVSSETLLHLDSLMKCNCVDQFACEVVACGRLPPGCQSRTPPLCAFSFVPRNVCGGKVVSRLAFPPPSTT